MCALQDINQISFIFFEYKAEKKIVNGEEQETVYNENELRRHFGFLHAMSVLGKEVNNDYYDSLRKENNEEKEELLQIK